MDIPNTNINLRKPLLRLSLDTSYPQCRLFSACADPVMVGGARSCVTGLLPGTASHAPDTSHVPSPRPALDSPPRPNKAGRALRLRGQDGDRGLQRYNYSDHQR